MTAVLVASDKFKGTLTSEEVGHAVSEGLRQVGVSCDVLVVADGGEGTADALRRVRGGRMLTATVSDALGRPIDATFVLVDDERLAFVDAAQAAGLWRLRDDERDPRRATSAGVGELIAAAAEAGADDVLLAPGGTATVDGGAGAIAVLRGASRVPRLRIACDVQTAWESAAEIFGPQKGADSATVETLARRLDELARTLQRDPRGVPMTGCGGALSGGLWACFEAELVPGAELVLDAIGFDELLADASLVITGEGRIDEQTKEGKLVAAVARRSAVARIPCVAVVGRNDLSADRQRSLGLACVVEAGTIDALREAGRMLAATRGPAV